jgi:hypothetical protein
MSPTSSFFHSVRSHCAVPAVRFAQLMTLTPALPLPPLPGVAAEPSVVPSMPDAAYMDSPMTCCAAPSSEALDIGPLMPGG